MTGVSRSVISTHPDALTSLKALASIVGASVSFSEEALTGKDGLQIDMTVSAHNSFSGSDTSYTVSGLLGCAKAICKAVPEIGFLGELSSNEDAASVESWIESAVTSLSVPAYVATENVKEATYLKQVEEFVASVETHLSSASKAFLVGDSATGADVCVAILLARAASQTGVSLNEKICAYLKSILENPAIVESVGTITVASNDSAPTAELAAMDISAGDFQDNAIVQKLNELSIPHNTYGHKLSVTADELLENVPLDAGKTHTKNLFFKDKKHGKFLVTVKPDSDLNTKKLGKDLKLGGKVNLRIADEDLLMESLAVKKGCVGPMCIMNNAAKDVTLVLDERLFEEDVKEIHSHPLSNDVSTALTPSDLKKFFEGIGVEPVIVPFEVKGTGKAPASRPDDAKTPKAASNEAQKEKQGAKAKNNKDRKTAEKGKTLLAVQWKKDENFAMWYSEVIVRSEMISYYDISGCYILRPWSYKIWEIIQRWFDIEIQKIGVENSYFPLFVSQDRLEKEKDHVEGFAPEVAWVTKSGDGELAKPIAVRPTSETIMYPAFSDWISSHRDLPLKLNQWSNVVRWEFKDPTPFLRSREFLWQEGHTAHASYEDADEMVQQALELYRRVYEDLYAVPVIPGYKTEEEKFAGGYQTTTVEAYIAGSGRAIQGATSHNLGQNFGKMFDITFQDADGESKTVWQTSWGLTTRSIGVMIMVHGDDQGLVLPPKIAPLQAVIVPIFGKKLTATDARPYCENILNDLQSAGIRAKYDDREIYNPGWKYNHWEQKGVPVRIEVGPRDIENGQVRIVLRYNGEKEDISVENIGAFMVEKLNSIQDAMFEKARNARDDHLVKVTEWKDFVPNLEKNNLVLTPWCGGEFKDEEEKVKEKSREESLAARGQESEDARTATSVAAKTLCIPFKQDPLPEGTKCFASGRPATCWVLWGRSY